MLSSFLRGSNTTTRSSAIRAKGVRRRPENQRQVFLDADEIAAAHAALDADTNRSAALALRLTLLTGCRIGEALTLDGGSDRRRAQGLDQAGGDDQAEEAFTSSRCSRRRSTLPGNCWMSACRTYDGCPHRLGARQGDLGREDVQNSRSETQPRRALARAGASPDANRQRCSATPRRRRRNAIPTWSTPIWSTWWKRTR